MQILLPLLFTSALVAALPQPQPQEDVYTYVTVIEEPVVVVTVTEYVDDSTPAPTPVVAQPDQPAPAQVEAAPTDDPQPEDQQPTPQDDQPPAPQDEQPAPAQDQPSQDQPTPPQDAQEPAPVVEAGPPAAGPTIVYSDSTLARMSTADVDSIYKTCWNGALEWPIPNTPAPCADVPAPQLSIYQKPATQANMLVINNYCGYDIHYHHFNGPDMIEQGVVTANSKYVHPLAGTVWKGSKKSDMTNDILIEYAVGGDGYAYYDLSMITCINDGDTSNCAGHEAGLQLGGSPKGHTFQCAAGAWCDDQVYMYQENLCKKQNPVSASPVSDGLTMDFCASMRH